MAASLTIVGPFTRVEVIASGRGVDIRKLLVKRYGMGRWRKMKGNAVIQLPDGSQLPAEIHCNEAHGIGRREFKIKRFLD